MSKSISNGLSVDIPVQATHSLKLAWLGGTYTAQIISGAANLPVALATNSASSQTFGPYATAIMVRLTVSAIGRVAWDTASTPVFIPPGEQFTRQDDGIPVTLSGVGPAAAFEVDGDGNSVSPPSAKIRPGAARVALWGSSIEFGSSATNAGSSSYGPRLKALVDGLRLTQVKQFGYPGEESSVIYTHCQEIIDEGFTHVIFGGGFGTNSNDKVAELGVYEAVGKYYEQAALRFAAAGIKMAAITQFPFGITNGALTGQASATGSTSTLIMPVGSSAVDKTYVGGQIELNGDGVVRTVRSYVGSARTIGFTPAAVASTTASTTFSIVGFGDGFAGSAAQVYWLTSNAPRLGITVFDGRTGLTDARGFFDATYTNDGVHPNEAGHTQISVVIAPQVTAWLPKMAYPTNGFGGEVYNPTFVGPASGAIPGGWGSVGPSTSGATKTHSVSTTKLGDAPQNTWRIVLDSSGGLASGNYRAGQSPSIDVTPGDVLFMVGTIQAVSGAGTATLGAWNGNATANIASIGVSNVGDAAKTFSSFVTVPAGCTAFAPVVNMTTVTNTLLVVDIAGIQVWNLTQMGVA